MLWFCDGFIGCGWFVPESSAYICCSLFILQISVKAVIIDECHVFAQIQSDCQKSPVVRVGSLMSYNSNWCIFSVLAILLMVN